MRVLVLTNNRLGLAVLRALLDQGDEVVGLVVHPGDHAQYRQEILEVAELPPASVFDATALGDPDMPERLKSLGADIGLSVLFGYILKPGILGVCPGGFLNLHPSLLPWNRGAHPNIWSIVDGTPAGVTLHWIDEGLDSGDIVAQRAVEVEPVDTGASLYRKLESAGLELFVDTWPAIRDGTADSTPQPASSGSSHRVRDLETLERIDLDAPTTARAVLDLLRARTYRPYGGAWFETKDGRRVDVRVSLEYREEPQ